MVAVAVGISCLYVIGVNRSLNRSFDFVSVQVPHFTLSSIGGRHRLSKFLCLQGAGVVWYLGCSTNYGL